MGKIKKKKSTILKNGGRRYTKHHFITNKRTRNVTIYEDVNHPTENVPIIKTNKSYVYGDDYITLPQFCWGNTSSEKLFSIEFSIGGMILSNSRQYLINRNFEIVCSTDGNFSIKIYLSISSIKATVTYGKHSCEVTCGYDLSKIDNSKDYRFRLECETNNQGQNCFNTYIRLASLDMEENSMTDGDEDISVPRNESVYGEGIKIKGIESTISFFLNIHSLEYRNTYPTESHIVYEPCCYYISNERYVGLYDDENSKLYTSNKCKKNTNKSNTSVSLLNIEEQGTFQKSHVETEEYTESSYGYYPNQQLSNIIEVEKPIWKNPPEYSFVTPYKDDKYL